MTSRTDRLFISMDNLSLVLNVSNGVITPSESKRESDAFSLFAQMGT